MGTERTSQTLGDCGKLLEEKRDLSVLTQNNEHWFLRLTISPLYCSQPRSLRLSSVHGRRHTSGSLDLNWDLGSPKGNPRRLWTVKVPRRTPDFTPEDVREGCGSTRQKLRKCVTTRKFTSNVKIFLLLLWGWQVTREQ